MKKEHLYYQIEVHNNFAENKFVTMEEFIKQFKRDLKSQDFDDIPDKSYVYQYEYTNEQCLKKQREK